MPWSGCLWLRVRGGMSTAAAVSVQGFEARIELVASPTRHGTESREGGGVSGVVHLGPCLVGDLALALDSIAQDLLDRRQVTVIMCRLHILPLGKIR